jgi:hypothetical protein
MYKVVLVGINNYANSPLRGCVNDADDVKNYLALQQGILDSEIVSLLDHDATKHAIIDALQQMIAGNEPGENMLFHFSGHGTQIVSGSTTEPDGLDEVLCPVDFDWNKPHTAISDDELGRILKSLPSGSTLTVVLDACHSGDAARELVAIRQPRFLTPPADVSLRTTRMAGTLRKLARGDTANSVVVSACESTETTADTEYDGRPNGAFTYNWLKALEAHPEASIEKLVVDVTIRLASFGTHPQLDAPSFLRTARFLGGILAQEARSPSSHALLRRGLKRS